MARKTTSVTIPEVVWDKWLQYQREKGEAGQPTPTFSALVVVALKNFFMTDKKNG
jgi:hypothetical protein